jgi:hypothetical protein
MGFSPNYIVYQAYGSLDIPNELIYSIASFYSQSNILPVSIVVYTDNIKYLSKYLPSSIIFEELSASKLIEWRGEINFVHRVKVEMLLDFCRKYSGNVLYLDTDTIFTKAADDLFRAISNDMLIMHANEGKMSITKNPIFDKIAKFLNKKLFHLNGNSITISVEQEMWNAGVLGFTTDEINMLYDVLALTDILYKQYKKHIMEQLAFSYIFSKKGLMTAAENHVFHYWNFKEFRPLLKEYFIVQDTFEKVLSTSHSINPAHLIIPKMKFEKQAHFMQQFKKYVLKQKWYMPNYSQIKS